MANSTTARRLMRETLELSSSSSNPNPAFFAHPASDGDLYEWHFVLAGPPAPSPFSEGLYHGRISLPRNYPLKPPNFRFLTPSARFEVNREICLSISSFHEESWMPAWGIRTALVALRTFMGEKGTAGQVGGMEAEDEVRRTLAKSSRKWKCQQCGGRSNEEIMSEWWQVCRDKGIELGTEAGLEELPEGLKLGFTDQLKKGNDTAKPDAARVQSATSTSRGDSHQVVNADAAGSAAQFRATDSSSSAQLDAATINARSQGRTINPSSSSAPPVQSSSSTELPTRESQTTATNIQQQGSTPILDKAISGLFLALFFMVLKKVLYNPNVIAHE